MNTPTTAPTQEKTIFNDEISQLSAWGLVKVLIGSAARASVRATSSVEAGFMAVETTIGLAQNEIDALAAEQTIRLDELTDEREVKKLQRQKLKDEVND